MVGLVIASLVCQLATAMWHGPAMAAAHSTGAGPLSHIIVICSSSGIRRIMLDRDGNPTELPEHTPADMQCPVCMALNQLQAAVVPSALPLYAPEGLRGPQRPGAMAVVDDRRPHIRCGLDPPV